MKNLKIKMKLTVSFGAIILLLGVVGAIGVLGMRSLEKANTDMYENNVLAIKTLGLIKENYASQRATIRNFIIYETDSVTFQTAITTLSTLESEMEACIAEYGALITDAEEREALHTFTKNYWGGFKDLKEKLLELGRQDLNYEAGAHLASDPIQKLSANIVESMSRASELNADCAQAAVEDNNALATQKMMILVCVFIVACVSSVLLSVYLSGVIAKPLVTMTEYMRQVVSSGDMTVRSVDEQNIQHCSQRSDEIGVCVSAVGTFVMRVLDIGKVLESVAEGDLTYETVLLSEKDTMGLYLKKMLQNLNDMFGEIDGATGQVSLGSVQVSDGSQALAQGSTEQAAAVEQLSSSISQIAGKTKDNVDLAEKASELAESIKQNAEKGSGQMDQMLEAVKEIQEASKSIGKVIKVIDDIAFQTNILALNAAVEAARAGSHGKGFAVVAEEVRSLAAKSADAAKDTESLIANSMEKSELGARIAGETAVSLSEIVVGINESGQIVENIARFSGEQSAAINQINSGIDQVAQVVQQNSATAQQSAAAAEEMSEQAHVLEGLVSRFKTRDGSLKKSVSAKVKRIDMRQKINHPAQGSDKYQ